MAISAPRSRLGLFPALAEYNLGNRSDGGGIGRDAYNGDGGGDGGAGVLTWSWNEKHGAHCCSPGKSLAHLHHMSWTAVWLLRLAAALDDNDNVTTHANRTLAFLSPYAELLVRHQDERGQWPAYWDPLTDMPVDTGDLHDFNRGHAEGSANSLFLIEFARALKRHPSTHDGIPPKAVVSAALQGLEFVYTHAHTPRRWWDFEAFWSCTPKPVQFTDPFTRQSVRNNLAQIVAPMAFLAATELTGDRTWLWRGKKILDELLLTQQVGLCFHACIMCVSECM